ncbi:hypothetical protein M885DRAFT_343602 [Pelagophyceae sp. CCMP2097]|nr:hypothetical protein M885DRAFT_343602 [Pelagophyceae sp. CCMP2097]
MPQPAFCDCRRPRAPPPAAGRARRLTLDRRPLVATQEEIEVRAFFENTREAAALSSRLARTSRHPRRWAPQPLRRAGAAAARWCVASRVAVRRTRGTAEPPLGRRRRPRRRRRRRLLLPATKLSASTGQLEIRRAPGVRGASEGAPRPRRVPRTAGSRLPEGQTSNKL